MAEATQSPRRAAVQVSQKRGDALSKVAGAWKRMMLAEDGKLHSDARLVLRDLFDKSAFYAAMQYVPGSPDATVALAAKRQLVTHIVSCITKSDEAIQRKFKRAEGLDDDHDDEDVDRTFQLMEKVYE